MMSGSPSKHVRALVVGVGYDGGLGLASQGGGPSKASGQGGRNLDNHLLMAGGLESGGDDLMVTLEEGGGGGEALVDFAPSSPVVARASAVLTELLRQAEEEAAMAEQGEQEGRVGGSAEYGVIEAGSIDEHGGASTFPNS